MSTQEGEVYRIDLGSGDVQRRQMELEERRGGPWVVLARQGGFVMADASYDDQTPVYGVVDGADGAAVPIGDWQSVENYGSLMPRVAPAAEPDEVWVWNDSINGQAVVVKRVRLDGTVTAGPVTLPRYGTVFGADGPGAVALRSERGLYRATIIGQDVQIEPISPRVPLAYSTAALLDLECDGALQCQVVVVDRATGTVRPVPGTVTDEVVPSYDLTLSGDGRWLANVVYDGPNSPELTVYDLTTGEALIRDSVIPKSYGFLGTPQSAEFTTDGKWLVFFTIDGGIRLWPVGSAGGVVSFSVPGVMNVNTVSVAP